MSENEIVSLVKDYARNISERNDIHGFPHIERVFDICVKIGTKLGAKLLILKIASLLHDIGRVNEEYDLEGRNHAEISAIMAEEFLKSLKSEKIKDIINEITHCIKAHSFSNNISPETLEAKILSDADKLDALGAIGLYRTIGFTLQKGGGVEQVIKHLEDKIMKLKDKMYLDYSKNLAEKRQTIILDFYDKIKIEK